MQSVANGLSGRKSPCSCWQLVSDVTCRGERISNSQLVNTSVYVLLHTPLRTTSSTCTNTFLNPCCDSTLDDIPVVANTSCYCAQRQIQFMEFDDTITSLRR
ncbi:hypothetical protein TNCV_2595011 [Trichonephila clavipes]|nr:hypothetical protein TNCV_2595011 [Trichonephila clavipes]